MQPLLGSFYRFRLHAEAYALPWSSSPTSMYAQTFQVEYLLSHTHGKILTPIAI